MTAPHDHPHFHGPQCDHLCASTDHHRSSGERCHICGGPYPNNIEHFDCRPTAAMPDLSLYDPEELNDAAGKITSELGWMRFSRRYRLAAELLDRRGRRRG